MAERSREHDQAYENAERECLSSEDLTWPKTEANRTLDGSRQGCVLIKKGVVGLVCLREGSAGHVV
jgi:hypothetical protein